MSPLPLLGPSRRDVWRRRTLRKVLAAVLLAVAAWCALLALRPPPAPTAGVLVAASDLPSGHVLTEGDVQVRAWPVGLVPPGALSDPAEPTGRLLSAPMTAGEVVTGSRLVPRGPADGLDAGEVAVHLPVRDAAALALVAPGATVTLLDPSGAALADGVRVLAVDPPTAEGEARAGPRGVVVATGRAQAANLLARASAGDGIPGVLLAVERPR